MSHPFPSSLRNVAGANTLKWVFVGGKGGVGKTSVSCSLAIEMASKRSNVLLISTDPAHNLSDSFGQQFSKDPKLVDGFDNLYAMELELDTEDLLHSSQETAGPSGIAGMIPFLRTASMSMPGIDEAVSFMQMMSLVESMDYDLVIFDTAPTGHTLRLLGFPDMILQMASSLSGRNNDAMSQLMSSMMAILVGASGMPSGFGKERADKMYNDALGVKQLFQDPLRCTFICVCIPEFLSVYETERLIQELTRKGIDVQNIIMNNIVYVKEEEKCVRCVQRARMQKKYIENTMELYEHMHVTLLPLLDDEVRSVPVLTEFGHMLMRNQPLPLGITPL